MRTPRKLKKQIKNCKILYDIVSKPKSLSLDETFDIFKYRGVLLWDSTRGGDKPQIIGKSIRLKIRKYEN